MRTKKSEKVKRTKNEKKELKVKKNICAIRGNSWI